MFEFIDDELSALEDAGLLRSLRTVIGPQGPRAAVDGKEVLLLCSNDYLGLANHPEVRAAAVEAAQRYGTGAGASRLVSGTMEAHRALEERVREFKGAEGSLLFNSGYNANIGVITTLAGRNTEIFSDRLNHASIVDACVLSRARVRRYPNRDMERLERCLSRSKAAEKLIVTDGVFSMDGTVAPLADIVKLADRYGAIVYLDDAHATGVIGPNGRGTADLAGIDYPGLVQMGTLGKAFGSFGAFVTGPEKLMTLLVTRARPFVYTTALPPYVCMASIKAMEIAEREPERRKKTLANAERLRARLNAAGLDTMGSTTQIIPVAVNEAARAVEAAKTLFDRGVFIQGIRPPTVPEGTSRLRVTVTAAHETDDIDKAAEAITASV